MLRIRHKNNKKILGQVIIEFTFCMFIVCLMIFSITKIFEWTGKEFVFRRQKHDAVLRDQKGVPGYWYANQSLQIQQISPYYSGGLPFNATWKN